MQSASRQPEPEDRERGGLVGWEAACGCTASLDLRQELDSEHQAEGELALVTG
ncbi:hypothetical protein [Streptomyces sp. NPDC005283]|uniref:hypothetical protein n=1 Tax=Streptomyces sp. NPDC005283 TaxID=3156871 RepID=UPI0034529544